MIRKKWQPCPSHSDILSCKRSFETWSFSVGSLLSARSLDHSTHNNFPVTVILPNHTLNPNTLLTPTVFFPQIKLILNLCLRGAGNSAYTQPHPYNHSSVYNYTFKPQHPSQLACNIFETTRSHGPLNACLQCSKTVTLQIFHPLFTVSLVHSER